jgi:hypothetical protein
MNDEFAEDIQYVDESDHSSELKSTSEPEIVRHPSFLQRLFGRSSFMDKHYY